MFMEMSQGNSLCNYLKQIKMSFTKSENRKVEQALSGVGIPVGGEKRLGQGGGVDTLYTCI
jgi:hypothetical protein